ncbi:MAG: hypothetical protein WBA36_03615 [Mesorhizobium sp.]
MPDFSETRRWWPHDLVDEVMPLGLAKPEDWLKPDANGVTTIHADHVDDKTVLARLVPGSVVEFLWYENRGWVDIRLMPDGTWSLEDTRDGGTIDMFTGQAASPPPPAARIEDANWFAAAGDYETMMDSMDGFAEGYAENEPSIDPDGLRVQVDMAFWSDPVKFRVSADGKSLETIDG